MLENVYQEEPLAAEPEELSPVDQLRLQWNQQPGPIPLLKQKNVIDSHPELLSCAGIASIKGWIWPYGFAFQGLMIAAILMSVLNWYITHDSGKLHEQITTLQATTDAELKRQQEIMDATEAEIRRISHSPREMFNLRMADRVISREEALAELNASLEESRRSAEDYKHRMELKEKDLRATASALAMARSGAPMLLPLALMIAAGGVRRGVQRENSRSKLARNSGDFFLYFATSEGLLLNLVLLAFAHLVLSGGNYGLEGFFETVGPLFQVVFWIGFYVLLLRYFAGIARGMNRALQLRPPASEWSPENRTLLHIHNNFWAVFGVLEGTFLAACYLFYHVDKRLF